MRLVMFPNPRFIRDFYIPNPFLQMYTQLRSKSMKATDNLAFFCSWPRLNFSKWCKEATTN